MRGETRLLVVWVLVGLGGAGCSSGSQSAEGQLADRGARLVEEAFLSGEVASVEAVLTEQSRLEYHDQLANADPQALLAFGRALATRKLQAISPLEAEYRIEIGGRSHTIALARAAEGAPWQLVRF